MKKLITFFAAVLLGSIGLHAGNTITYTATAQLPGNNGSLNVGATTFGPAITSHTFSNGTGTITCSGEITAIPKETFDGCANMMSIELPNSVTEIGDAAFRDCVHLTSMTIPNSVKTIGDFAFVQCHDLQSVTLGNSVDSIGVYAFWQCANLAFVEIPSSVTKIGNNAFQSCDSLTMVKVNWTDAVLVAPINSNVFRGIANGAGPAGATLIVPVYTSGLYQHLDEWKDFGSIVEIDSITYTASAKLSRPELNVGAFTFGSPIIVHDFLDGVGTIVCAGPIAKIGMDAFLDCFDLTSVQIPNTVTEIEEQAFYSCSKLTSIEIPNSVTTIGHNAFYKCIGLTSIVVENGNNKYDSRDNCNAIVETATNKLLYACQNTIIPSSITAIEDWAFFNCIGWTSVKVNWTTAQSIASLGNDAFTGIANGAGPAGAMLYVPVGMYNLYHQANGWKDFGGIVDLDNKITYTAPAKLSGFYYGSLDEGATTFGSMIIAHDFSDGVGMIVCNGPITKIGEDAFRNCKSLTSIEIPTSVVEIEKNAFYSSGLTSVEIPKSVKSLGMNAFYDCQDMTSVKVNWTDSASIVSIDLMTFGWIAKEAGPKGAKLYVPAGTYGLYKGTKGWKEFGCIVDLDNKITYTASAQIDSERLNVGATTFGSPIFSHDFSNGIGTIICNGPITKVGDYAFWEYSNLTSITIPSSVTTIGIWAFYKCKGLTSVTIPNSVKQIDRGAFSSTQVNKVVFAERKPTDAIQFGAEVFREAALEEVAIPEWMTVVPEGLFFSNKKLRAIYLPASVNHINQYAFHQCDSVKCVVSMAATPPALGASAFVDFRGKNDVFVYVPSQDAITAYKNSDWKNYFPYFTTDIEYRIVSTTDKTAEVVRAIPFDGKVSVPAMAYIDGNYYTVIGIGKDAFRNDTLLQSISLPPSIQYIGNGAFNGCTQLKQTSIETLEDLQTIGNSAFYGCSALDSIYIPEGVQTIRKRAFMNCSSLMYVKLPESLKIVEDSCFWQCNLQPEITIPEGTETIGIWSFYNDSKLRIINLPSTLKEIKHGGFEACDSITKVISLALTPPAIEDTFAITSKKIVTVYVPNRDVVAAYMVSNWGSEHYNFKFADLMAEENKKYLYIVAGENDSAKATAKLYCDSIDDYTITTTAQQVQDYTNRALEKIDKLTLVDYKQALADSLERHAGDNAEAKLIASQYAPQIINAYFRDVAERLFIEGDKKIAAIFELIALKEQYCNHLQSLAEGDPDMEKVAQDYGNLIRLAETKEEARALYDRAVMRMTVNSQIKNDWQGMPIKVNDHECSTTRGFIY